MPRTPAPRIPEEEWNSHKDIIRDLYINQEKSLQELMDYMKLNHTFFPTKKQYIRKLGTWGFRKNISSDIWNQGADIVHERQASGKNTKLVIHGRVLSEKRQKKGLGRENVKKRCMRASSDVSRVVPNEVCALSPATDSGMMHGVIVKDPFDPWEFNSPNITYEILPSAQFISCLERLGFGFSSSGGRGLMSVLNSTMFSSSGNLTTPINTISSRLCNIIESKLGHRQTGDVITSSPWLPALCCAVYMAANALLSRNQMQNIAYWVESVNIMPYIKPLIELGGPSFEIFASKLLEDAISRSLLYHVQLLLGAGIQANARGQEYPRIPLIELAAKKGDPQIVKALLQSGADPNDQGAHKLTVLESLGAFLSFSRPTIEKDRLKDYLKIIELLIQAGATISNMFVALTRHSWVRGLFNEKTLFSLFESSRFTDWKIQYALLWSDIRLLRSLLCEGVDVNCLCYQADRYPITCRPATPIAVAVLQNNLRMVHLLLEKGADPDMTVSGPAITLTTNDSVCTSNSMRALDYVVEKETDSAIIELLLNSPQKILLNAIDKGEIEVMRSLLNQGFDPNSRILQNRTMLEYWVRSYSEWMEPNESLARLLLEYGADVNVTDPEDGLSLLAFAIMENDPSLVNLLFSLGADISSLNGYPVSKNFDAWCQDDEPCTQDECAEIVLMLVDKGVDLNAHCPCNSSMTFIQLAIAIGSFSLCTILLDKGADPTKYCRAARRPPLQTAVNGTYMVDVLKMIDTLSDLGADINGYELTRTRLQCFSRLRGLKRLISEVEMTPLQAAAMQGCHRRVIRLIIDKGGDINIPLKGPTGFTALQWAIQTGNRETIDALVEFGADINAPAAAQIGFTALQAAIITQDHELITNLLEANANVNAPAPSKFGYTALQAAILANNTNNDNTGLIKKLIEAGADINSPPSSIDGKTALQAAVMQNNSSLTKELLEMDANVNAPACMNGGATALQYAAMNGNIDLVSQLLEYDADINARPSRINGRTALQGAAEHGRLDIVHLLLNRATGFGPSECEEAAKLADHEGHGILGKSIRFWANLCASPEFDIPDEDLGSGVEI